jgi:anti-sigma B factor antagonist
MSSFFISDNITRDGVVIVVVDGELDYEASPLLKERIAEHLKGDGQRLVLDLSSVTFIDSTAIGVLAGAAARFEEAEDGSMAVVCVHAKVLQILELTGLDSLVALYSSREEALVALAPTG